MSSTKPFINFSVFFFTFLAESITKLKQQKKKTHDYSQFVCGTDYVLEAINNFTYYMTSQGEGIKYGDYIKLSNGSGFDMYQIEEINYYSEPSDMWMALLKKVVID